METTKILISGNSQAMHISEEYRFSGTEADIGKTGNTVVLIPIDQVWETFLNGLNGFTDDFLLDGRQEQL